MALLSTIYLDLSTGFSLQGNPILTRKDPPSMAGSFAILSTTETPVSGLIRTLTSTTMVGELIGKLVLVLHSSV